MAKAGTLGRMAAFSCRVPLVLHTFHGTVFQGHFQRGLGEGIARWERVMGSITDQVLAVSPAAAEELARRRIARGKVRVMPLGLDLEPFLRVAPLGTAPPHVVSLIARLAPVKDVPLFIRATELVKEEIADLEVRIIGDGPLRRTLEMQAPPWISFLGHRGDLPDLLTSTGAVVLTSHSEGSPVALIEALAAARPVVSTPVGGVVDILRDRPGAVLTSDRSPAALATAISRALTDASLGRAAAHGRHEVADEFGIGRLIDDVEALYEEVWAARRRP
jgi:glycosyltransferase involved in cell wall biosynthesis